MRSDLLAPLRREERRRRAAAAAGVAAVLAAVAVVAARLELPRYLAGILRAGDSRGELDVRSSSDAAVDAALVTPPATAAVVAAPPVVVAPQPAAAVQTRPLSAWLGDVARDAQRELVISPEVRGDLTATGGSDRLDWQSRIQAYARVFGFEFEVGEGLIEVRPAARSARAATERNEGVLSRKGFVTTAATVAAEEADGIAHRDISTAEGATAASKGSQAGAAADKPAAPPAETRVASLSYAPAKELAAVVDKAAQALGVSAAADVASNALVLSGPRAGLDRAATLVAQLDRPRRRVLLEAKIVEVAHSARRDLGIEWKLAGDIAADIKLPPIISEAGNAALLVATNGASALDARISAMEANGKLRVVSRPSVVMLEGSPATIESVRILRIRLPSRGAVVGDDVVEVSNSSDRATQDIPVGVRLEVTPGIRAGRKVLLRISAKSSSLGAPLPPDDIPEELSRMVEAEVMVADGETAVLGGLLREAGSSSGAGVPFLRDVPVLGHVFSRRARQKESEELLVLVTPRVLD
ncbi:MAG TPA: secretin N-terminal domain-containing protein [Candidatus Binatia bacterium]|nr:secretin N-terminal domain-containing protein [Candidatus Binatia bacterium]